MDFSDRHERRRSAPLPPKRAEPAPPATAGILALQRAIGNRATGRVLQRMTLRADDSGYVRDPDGAVDTRKLDRTQRKDLVEKLTKGQQADLLKEIQQEWREQRQIRPKGARDLPLLEELVAISTELEPIETETRRRGGSYAQLPGPQKKSVEQVTVKLKAIVDRIEEGLDEFGGVGLNNVRALFKRIATLTGEKRLLDYGVPPEYAQPITAADIEAYRADTLEMGVWAGPGEAEALAQALHVSFHIYVIAGGKYRRAYPNIGAGQPAAGRSLLFLGNHYVVLRNADLTDGADAPETVPVVAVTEARGDCLYEGVYIVAHGVKPKNYNEQIGILRHQAATAMSEVAVETAITLIRSGSRQGVGSRMQKGLQDAGLRDLDARLKKQQGYAEHAEEIDRLFKAYAKASAAAKDGDEPPWELTALQEKLAEVADVLLPSGEEEWVNPLSVPKRLYRYVSTEAGKEARKNGIKFDEVGGGIPTSTKGDKGVAVQSGAVFTNVLLTIDTSKIPGFKFEYVPTRTKLKEVKIKCDVPPEAIS
jgi:hypothetical protein